MAKRSSTKRDLVDTGRNKMFAKRNAKGQFKEMDDGGRLLTADRRRTAKIVSEAGHAHQGDRPRGAKKR